MSDEQRANPGGSMAPENIIGRDEFIESLWDTLEQQSVMMTAERRIGKTSIMSKMKAEPKEGWRPVYLDLEKLHTAMDFALAIYQEVGQFLKLKDRAARKATEVYAALGGGELGGVFKVPEGKAKEWKSILTSSVEDLVENFDSCDERLLFFWDEMPSLLEHIRDNESPEVALELLDVLRALRIDHGDALRMVITGSIGIHHVLKTLKKDSKTALNDIFTFEVEPLAQEHARELGKRLLRGEKIACSEEEVAEVLADECDCFAFYIHHVVKDLKLSGQEATVESVKEVVTKQLMDEHDPWELDHFSERLEGYYGKDEAVVKLILDEFALSGERSPKEILSVLKGASKFDDQERLRNLLKFLVQDHYLAKSTSGNYQFRFSLIQRWWKLHRNLG